jgi:hypothetical protein
MAPTSRSPSAKDAPKPDLSVATVVSVEPNEPYPTGAPPDFSAVVLRVHTPQAQTEAAHWPAQSEENLAAGGMIAHGLPYEPPEEPPPPEPEEDTRKVKKEATPQQGRKSLFGK